MELWEEETRNFNSTFGSPLSSCSGLCVALLLTQKSSKFCGTQMILNDFLKTHSGPDYTTILFVKAGIFGMNVCAQEILDLKLALCFKPFCFKPFCFKPFCFKPFCFKPFCFKPSCSKPFCFKPFWSRKLSR